MADINDEVNPMGRALAKKKLMYTEEVKPDNSTVWRITAGDFREIINQHFPEWTEKEVNKVIERASRDFNIEGWEDIVYTFSYFYYQDIKKEEGKKRKTKP